MHTYLVPVPLGIWADKVKIDLGIVGMENELKLHFRVTLSTDPLRCMEVRILSYMYMYLATILEEHRMCTFY